MFTNIGTWRKPWGAQPCLTCRQWQWLWPVQRPCKENVRSSRGLGWCFEGRCQALKKDLCACMCRDDAAMNCYCEHDRNSHGAAPNQWCARILSILLLWREEVCKFRNHSTCQGSCSMTAHMCMCVCAQFILPLSCSYTCCTNIPQSSHGYLKMCSMDFYHIFRPQSTH